MKIALRGRTSSFTNIGETGVVAQGYSINMKEVNEDRISCYNPTSHERWNTLASSGDIPVSISSFTSASSILNLRYLILFFGFCCVSVYLLLPIYTSLTYVGN